MIEFVYLIGFFVVLLVGMLVFQNWQKRNGIGVEFARMNSSGIFDDGMPNAR